MPTRTRNDLGQSLKKGQVEPVYFLYGEETYLRRRRERSNCRSGFDRYAAARIQRFGI
jgi:DNA polymerase III delta subunit